jgi:hypothetical protein
MRFAVTIFLKIVPKCNKLQIILRELFTVFPNAAIPAFGLIPQESCQTSHYCSQSKKDQIPHVRPPSGNPYPKPANRSLPAADVRHRKSLMIFVEKQYYRVMSYLLIFS